MMETVIMAGMCSVEAGVSVDTPPDRGVSDYIASWADESLVI